MWKIGVIDTKRAIRSLYIREILIFSFYCSQYWLRRDYIFIFCVKENWLKVYLSWQRC